jgi:hypothetical protein
VRHTLSTPIASLLLIVAACAASSNDSAVARASFNADGSINLPLRYRQWSHVGTSFKLSGINVLDLSPIKSPELLEAYVEPSAMARFQADGIWPDGSQIVKEYSAIRTGNGCDQQTHICDTSFGDGIYEATYDGLAMMVKDAKRFPNAPGNWAYVSFGHKAPPYDSRARVLPTERCQFCHQKLATDTDYVVVRAHIGLMGR